ncbi:MAG: sugar nucleotide-binding protein [Prevotella sp.]|jgi:dTDP-4-dehydrorhamnose reductase|nr:sugar nucleotide-binding protein [Prevotella sp.]
MRTINIVGANGVIGSYIYKRLLKAYGSVYGTYCNNLPIDINDSGNNIFLDITNRELLEKVFLSFDGSLVILLSSLKDVKKCEADYENACKINTWPIRQIIDLIKVNKLDIKLVYFSSDYVFEGTKGHYGPFDPLYPKTNYGRTKALAEQYLRESDLDYKIIRTSAVMGPRAPFYTWLLNAINNEDQIELFNNVYFTPTPINFLYDVILNIVGNYEKISDTILHIVGEKRLSRFEFAEKINSLFTKKARLIPIEKDLSIDTFQYDLSMIQSLYVKNLQNKTLFEYLKELATHS